MPGIPCPVVVIVIPASQVCCVIQSMGDFICCSKMCSSFFLQESQNLNMLGICMGMKLLEGSYSSSWRSTCVMNTRKEMILSSTWSIAHVSISCHLWTQMASRRQHPRFVRLYVWEAITVCQLYHNRSWTRTFTDMHGLCWMKQQNQSISW